jgi:hypothetical protein
MDCSTTEIVELPDDMGTMADASYCDIRGWFHIDIIVGVDDCSVAKDDEAVEYTQVTTYHGGKCMKLGDGESVMVECVLGSCPTGYNDNGKNAKVTEPMPGHSLLAEHTVLMRHRMARI